MLFNKSSKMKNRFIAIFFVFSLISLTIEAQEKQIRDRRTDPTSYYLRDSDVANSVALLPEPPALNSILFLNDRAQYEWGLLQRNTARGDQAAQDANIDPEGLSKAFSDAFGIEISQSNTPEIYKLITNMRNDAGDLATRDAKEHYQRVRPFVLYKENTCNIEQQTALASNGSYPSGHTAVGWAVALVLSEVNVDRQNEILKRGYEIGQSRVICGYHYQSDVDAGRLVGSAVVARLHADSAFSLQLDRAKEEYKRLRKTN